MKASQSKKWIAWIACLLLVTAFQTPTKKDLIQEKLAERVLDYRQRIEANCQQRIYEQAAAIVDSMLIDRAKSTKDTLNKPPKPLKPDHPDYIPPKDSMPVKRLFKDSVGLHQ